MAEFANQTELRAQLIAAVAPYIPEIEKWRETWARLPDEKKIDWLCDGKSMFLSGAAGVFIYLYPFFASLCDEIDSGKILLNLQTMQLRRPE